MASTDIEERLWEGLAAIVEADAGVAALCAPRVSDFVRPALDLAEGLLPIVVGQPGVHRQVGGIGDNRFITVQWSVLAAGNNARSTARHLLERLELGITQPLLAAQGLDACPLPGAFRRYSGAVDPEDSRGLVLLHADQDYWITK